MYREGSWIRQEKKEEVNMIKIHHTKFSQNLFMKQNKQIHGMKKAHGLWDSSQSVGDDLRMTVDRKLTQAIST